MLADDRSQALVGGIERSRFIQQLGGVADRSRLHQQVAVEVQEVEQSQSTAVLTPTRQEVVFVDAIEPSKDRLQAARRW